MVMNRTVNNLSTNSFNSIFLWYYVKQKKGALCYPYCRSGYKGVGPVCWQICPSDSTDTGATCWVTPDTYGKGCCCTKGGCCHNCRAGYTDNGCTCGKGGSFVKDS